MVAFEMDSFYRFSKWPNITTHKLIFNVLSILHFRCNHLWFRSRSARSDASRSTKQCNGTILMDRVGRLECTQFGIRRKWTWGKVHTNTHITSMKMKRNQSEKNIKNRYTTQTKEMQSCRGIVDKHTPWHQQTKCTTKMFNERISIASCILCAFDSGKFDSAKFIRWVNNRLLRLVLFSNYTSNAVALMNSMAFRVQCQLQLMNSPWTTTFSNVIHLTSYFIQFFLLYILDWIPSVMGVAAFPRNSIGK